MSKTQTYKPKDTGTFAMWLCLPIGMYAIAHRWPGSYDAEADPRDIMVRTRKAKYLSRLRASYLPELSEDEGRTASGTDYGHRAFVSSADLARGLACMALSIDASGFKDHCADNDLHSVYSQVWSAFVRLDDNSPYNYSAKSMFNRPEVCEQYGTHWWNPREGTGRCQDCGARRTKLASGKYRHSYPGHAVRLPLPAKAA